MQLTPEEAAAALNTIESSRRAMCSVARAHRGHLYLWLWGSLWTAMAVLAQSQGNAGIRLFPWISIAGTIASAVIGITQGNQVRVPVDRRFLAVMGAVVGFALIFPLVLRFPVSLHAVEDSMALFSYCALVAMLCYVIAGIWFDVYLFWVGLAVSALILAGLFLFPAFFWVWFAVFGGGTLIATGFYVRFGWK